MAVKSLAAKVISIKNKVIDNASRHPRLWGGICISLIVLIGGIVYLPVLKIGFWTDDYAFIDSAGRLDAVDYWISYLDPRMQWHWYRPMQGLQWWVSYHLFGGDARGHHLIQLGLHLINSALLFDLVRRITRRWLVGLISALIFVTFTLDSLAVFWVAVADPLAGVFCLLCLRLWAEFLQTNERRWFSFAVAALIAALGSKEVAAVLPIVLFLFDRLVLNKPSSFGELIKRYSLLAVILAVYGIFELSVLTRGVFTSQLGYGIGGHIFGTMAVQSAILAFPWGLPTPLNYIWLAAVIALVVSLAIKRDRRIMFIAAAMLLSLLPVLPFQPNMASAARYLYLPLMGTAVGFGLVIVWTLERFVAHYTRFVPVVAMTIALLFFFWNGSIIDESATAFEGTARQVRTLFRPIFQAHPSFPSDTLLYFVDPPMESGYVSGLALLRYGRKVSVRGNDHSGTAELSRHNAAWIFSFDDEGLWHEVRAAKDISASPTPALPIRFEGGITLEGLEVASDKIKRGENAGLILYWRAFTKIENDLTIFVHLDDMQGAKLIGKDSLLRPGSDGSTAWQAGEMFPTAFIIPSITEIPPGEYRVRIGLYEPKTMQRRRIIGPDEQHSLDSVTVASFWILE
jgi:hypothetical protein